MSLFLGIDVFTTFLYTFVLQIFLFWINDCMYESTFLLEGYKHLEEKNTQFLIKNWMQFAKNLIAGWGSRPCENFMA